MVAAQRRPGLVVDQRAVAVRARLHRAAVAAQHHRRGAGGATRAAIAGLALLGTIGGGLAVAVRDERHREAALITFLVTLSGVVVAGIGSAFWGVVAGALALLIQQFGRADTPRGA